MPELIYHDGARYFTGDRTGLSVALERIGVANLTATAYHPQSVGGVERLNQKLVVALRKLSYKYPDVWDLQLPGIMRGFAEATSRATGASPDQVLFSFVPRTPSSAVRAATQDPSFTRPPASAQAMAIAIRAASPAIMETILATQQLTNATEKAFFDRKHAGTATFIAGDLVWRQLPAGAGSSKLTSWHGTVWEPYTVVKALDTPSYYVVRDFIMGLESKVHVGQLRKFHATHLSDKDLILEARDPMTFVAERIIRHEGSTVDDLRFVVKWAGYDSLHNTTEPFYGRSGVNGHLISRFGESDLAQAYLRASGIHLPSVSASPPTPPAPAFAPPAPPTAAVPAPASETAPTPPAPTSPSPLATAPTPAPASPAPPTASPAPPTASGTSSAATPAPSPAQPRLPTVSQDVRVSPVSAQTRARTRSSPEQQGQLATRVSSRLRTRNG